MGKSLQRIRPWALLAITLTFVPILQCHRASVPATTPKPSPEGQATVSEGETAGHPASAPASPAKSEGFESDALPGSTISPSPGKAVEEYPFCGARGSRVFHRCDAGHVSLIKPENLVKWKSREEALATERAPCKLCNP